MALGWVVMLALLGFWSGTTAGGPTPHLFPQKTREEKFVSPAERFEQKAQQTLILGRSI